MPQTRLAYETGDWTPTEGAITEALYEGYVVQSVVVPGAKFHPEPHPDRSSMPFQRDSS
jgi:hypothetical protein